MDKKLFVLIFVFLLFNFFSTKVLAEKQVESNLVAEEFEAKKLDSKAKILADYLKKQDSPLQYHAQDFIDAAKTYNLDWKLVPAIAGVESTFGKQIPGGFNAWGWGVYGNQAVYFNSWTEAIFTISKGLRENYLDKGLTDPYSINRAYAVSPYWGGKVAYFMTDLDKFASQFGVDGQVVSQAQTAPQIAVVSASLAPVP